MKTFQSSKSTWTVLLAGCMLLTLQVIAQNSALWTPKSGSFDQTVHIPDVNRILASIPIQYAQPETQAIKEEHGLNHAKAYLPRSLHPGLQYCCSIDQGCAAFGMYQSKKKDIHTVGNVMIYCEQDQNWKFQQLIQSPTSEPGTLFGYSVALKGNTLCIGAPGADKNSGRLYIYQFKDNKWNLQSIVKPEGIEPGDGFGMSIAILDCKILVGAPYDDILDNKDQGSVYVFEHTGGAWMETERLYASDGMSEDDFGYSITTFGNQCAISAYNADMDGFVDRGKVFVYQHQADAFRLTAIIHSPETMSKGFGYAITMDDDQILVGAPTTDILGRENAGKAYLFNRINTKEWVCTKTFSPPTIRAHQYFGWQVSLQNDELAVATFPDPTKLKSIRPILFMYPHEKNHQMITKVNDAPIEDVVSNHVEK